MGILATPQFQRTLRSQHLVGRDPTCDLVVSNAIVSSRHAELRFRHGWTIRDLDSRNGTFVNGSRIKGEVRLRADARIGFGSPDVCWELRCDAAPTPFATSLDRSQCDVRGSASFLALPDLSVPVLLVVQTTGGWRAEGIDQVWRARDREIVAAAGMWQLHLPTQEESTAPARHQVHLAEATMVVLTSPDLEHIELEVTHRGGAYRLDHAVFHELVYVLAQADPANDGWLHFDDLARQLSLDPDRVKDRNRLRSWIHRVRRRFEGVGVCDAAGIIERREGTREVRLGLRAVHLAPLPTD